LFGGGFSAFNNLAPFHSERRATMATIDPAWIKSPLSKASAETVASIGRAAMPERVNTPIPFLDNPLTAALQSAAPIIVALEESDYELRKGAIELFKQLNSGQLDAEACHATTALLAEMLFPEADPSGILGLDLVEAEETARANDPEASDILARMDEEEAVFARRLSELMEAKGLTQAELAARVGLGQPAVSMMLNRTCRPQRKTVLRFAQALEVSPQELWQQFQA
jgi:lambda repressor-like predicted transcriptional regulator